MKKIKHIRFLSLLLVFTFLLNTFSLTSFAMNQSSVDVEYEIRNINETEFDIDVIFLNNPGIMGYKMLFQYEASELTPVSITAGKDFNVGQITDTIGVKSGQFNVLWNNLMNCNNSGVAFTLRLKKNINSSSSLIQVNYSQEDTFDEDWNDIILNCQDIDLHFTPETEEKTIDVSYEVGELDSNHQFTVGVNFDNNPGIMGYKMKFSYDDSVIKPVSVVAGEASSIGQLTDTIGVKNGEFNVLWNNLSAVKNTGNVFTITFEKLANEDTTIDVSYSQEDTFDEDWNDVILNCQDITIQLNCTNHNYIVVSQKAADCVNAGEIVYRCTVCSNEYIEIVPALGHKPVTLEAVPATCTETGLTEGSKCSVCGEILVARQEVKALGHNYVETITKAATCEEDGEKTFTCARCNDSYKETIKALGHNWNEWSVIIPASCSAEGLKIRVCKNDVSHIERETIEKLPHTPVTLEAVPATCTEPGLTEGSKCSVCGEILVARQEVKALGHNYVETITKAATCEEDGEKTFTCSRCNDSYKETIKALGHDWGSWNIMVDSTCAKEGLKIRVCKNDVTHIDRAPIEKLPHTPVTLEAKAPTCTEPGLTEGSKCSVCGEILVVQQEVKALGHDYTKKVISQEALRTPKTDDAPATYYYTCTRCGEVEHNDAHFFTDDALICVKLQLETVIGRQAVLTLLKDGKQVTATAQNGVFAFSDLEPGTYQVYADAHNGVRVKVQNIALAAKDYGKTIALEKEPVPLGDVNDDDVIDINDVALLLSEDVYDHNNEQFDLNGDSIIDIADISIILASINYGKSSVSINSID